MHTKNKNVAGALMADWRPGAGSKLSIHAARMHGAPLSCRVGAVRSHPHH